MSPLLYIIYLAYVLGFIFLAYALLYNVITRTDRFVSPSHRGSRSPIGHRSEEFDVMPVREDLRAKFAVYNPHDQPTHMLPIIYGFNNGGQRDWWNGCLLAEDGTALGGHVCSHEGFMYGDLGILEGSRPDRHEHFRGHYPDGYRMDFVPKEDVKTHPGLAAAYQKNQALAADEASAESGDRSAADASSVAR